MHQITYKHKTQNTRDITKQFALFVEWTVQAVSIWELLAPRKMSKYVSRQAPCSIWNITDNYICNSYGVNSD